MTGPDMRYESGTLRRGAGVDREAADRAAAAEAVLRSGRISGSAFGDVSHAATLAAQAVATRQQLADGARGAAVHRTDQGARADSTAERGDDLTAGTTAVAGGV